MHYCFESTDTFSTGGRHRAASLSTSNFSPVNSRCEAIVMAGVKATSRAEGKLKRGRHHLWYNKKKK